MIRKTAIAGGLAALLGACGPTEGGETIVEGDSFTFPNGEETTYATGGLCLYSFMNAGDGNIGVSANSTENEKYETDYLVIGKISGDSFEFTEHPDFEEDGLVYVGLLGDVEITESLEPKFFEEDYFDYCGDFCEPVCETGEPWADYINRKKDELGGTVVSYQHKDGWERVSVIFPDQGKWGGYDNCRSQEFSLFDGECNLFRQ